MRTIQQYNRIYGKLTSQYSQSHIHTLHIDTDTLTALRPFSPDDRQPKAVLAYDYIHYI